MLGLPAQATCISTEETRVCHPAYSVPPGVKAGVALGEDLGGKGGSDPHSCCGTEEDEEDIAEEPEPQTNSGGRKGEETKGLSNKWSSMEGRAGENKDEEAYTGESGQGTQGLDIQQRMTKENK